MRYIIIDMEIVGILLKLHLTVFSKGIISTSYVCHCGLLVDASAV